MTKEEIIQKLHTSTKGTREMNANELADYLDNNVEAMIMSEQQHIDKAATMLRQQQAEIEALKSDTIPYKDLHQVVKNVLAQPMRELTDEEIMEIYDRDELYNIDEGQMYIKPIEFAKELLKKASEK